MEFQDYKKELERSLKRIDLVELGRIKECLFEAYKNEKNIFIIGNGGSATTASHFACDLGKGTIGKDYHGQLKRFRVSSLTDNVGIITAYGNDLGYDDIFSQQLKNVIQLEDVLISITGSGNSKNILKAMELAKDKQAVNIAFLGFDGGKARDFAHHKIIVDSQNYGIIEDLHLTLEHMLCQNLEKKIKESFNFS